MSESEWRNEGEAGAGDKWVGDENGSPVTGKEGAVGKKWWKIGVGEEYKAEAVGGGGKGWRGGGRGRGRW